ncbi:MAG: hypothetical protein SP1CHLAM54_07180 [Chlamydiia bacterium]|nr:hypothetical protein [Chlamydiia bacterium]MCH9615624.1 hypothetical protein [Chlamydiia bacterium]MCH9628973.1 hypothetical protein [Chlamydiia bacterium]
MHIKEFNLEGVHLGAITINFNEQKDHLTIPIEAQEVYLALLDQAKHSPKEVYKDLVELLSKHPKNAEILSLYSFVCFQLKKFIKGNRAIKDNYQFNKDNLFAQINYGNLLVRRNRKRAFRKLFKHHDLTKIYPHKTTFHITEYRGFMTMMGFYFILEGARNKAICYHYLAKIADPSHPSVVCLGKKLKAKSHVNASGQLS